MMSRLKLSFLIIIIFLLYAFTNANKLTDNWHLVGFEDYSIEHVYAKGDTIWVSTMDSIYKSEVFFSFNGGDIWQKVADADTLINGWLKLLRVSPYKSTEIYALTLNGRGLKSVDGGQNWNFLFPELEPWPRSGRWFKEIHISPYNAKTQYARISWSSFDILYRSLNNGEDWENLKPSFPGTSHHGSTFTIALDPVDSLKLYAAIDDQGGTNHFYKSYDGGEKWNFSSYRGGLQIIPHTINPDTIYMLPSVSHDNGETWQRLLKDFININQPFQPWVIASHQMSNHPFDIFTSIVKWDSTFSYRETIGILQKASGVDSWTIIPGSEKLNFSPSLNFNTLFIDGKTNKLYTGTREGLYSYDLITSIDETDYNPKENILSQNYPNPFNPITKINYKLAMNSRVALKIYDISGREIITLVRGQKNAGEHSVTFDGTGLPSGVYFYRVTTSTGFSQSRKMLLVK